MLNNEDTDKQLHLARKNIRKLKTRMDLLEDRLEKLDGVKQLRPVLQTEEK